MWGRLVSFGVALAFLVVIGGAIGAACYSLPTPDCGFACGPNGLCPDDYTCGADRRCRRDGAPADLHCPPLDAAVPADAAPDTRDASDAMPDATTDAMPDATSDAMPDAI